MFFSLKILNNKQTILIHKYIYNYNKISRKSNEKKNMISSQLIIKSN